MRKVRKPYDLLMVTLALLFRPSTCRKFHRFLVLPQLEMEKAFFR